MDNNRASAAHNLRKISPSCVGSEKFFSTVVSYEKYNFRLFHCVQPTKIITIISPTNDNIVVANLSGCSSSDLELATHVRY